MTDVDILLSNDKLLQPTVSKHMLQM